MQWSRLVCAVLGHKRTPIEPIDFYGDMLYRSTCQRCGDVFVSFDEHRWENETGAGKWNRTNGARPFNNDGKPTDYQEWQQSGDAGSAARFFKCCPFDIGEHVAYNEAINQDGGMQWASTGQRQSIRAESGTLPERGTTDSPSGTQRQNRPDLCWPITGFGNRQTGLSQKDSLSTTETETSRITGLKTLPLLTPQLTSVCIAGASCETVCGGNPAMFAENSSHLPPNIGTLENLATLCTGDAESATSELLSKRSENARAAETPRRMIYCPKASRSDRDDGLPDGVHSQHPTVKATSLMRYLCRLITPPGGVVLDPFMGSGSTGKGAVLEGFSFVGIEAEAEYFAIAQARIDAAEAQAQPRMEGV